MLLILFVILLAVFVSALYVVYILLKSNHRIISTIIDVQQTFQLINAEQFLLIEQISKNYLNEVEYTIYKKFSFKTFLLYLCYCLNEQFKENLNNHLVDN